MKKLALVTALSLVMAAPAQAAEKEKFEKEPLIGLGSGAAAGALIAGPAGAAVGGILGLFIGKIEGDKVVVAEQQQALAKSEQALIALQHKTSNYHDILASNEILNDKVANLELEKINNLMALTVQFKTGSSTIEPHFEAQLIELASILNANPNIELELNGFADQRGDEQANLVLSQQRVESVSSFLIKQGVSHARLSRYAFGEQHSLAQSASYEDDFFDRRVTVTAKPVANATATAQSQY